MQITSIGHASILIESRGTTILADPWWRGPCFGAQWWNYPPPYLAPTTRKIDYIYISHGHHDHFHPGTLKTLNRDAKVLVSRNIDIGDPIRQLGFEVIALGDDDEHTLAPGLTCRIMETHAADTLFAVSDGERVCLNLNDALHSAPLEVEARFTALLKSLYPRIDYLFCGYGVASHFPNCYVIPGKDREATAARRQAHFNRRWAHIVNALNPTFAFPFAADVVFLERDLMWVNEPIHNSERPTAAFRALYPQSRTIVMDAAPGFEILDDTVTRPNFRQLLSLAQLQSDYADKIIRANEYGTGTDAVFEEVLELVRGNVEQCSRYLREYSGAYRFLLRFRNYPIGILIEKRENNLSIEPATKEPAYNLVYTTRLQYVRWSLSTPYGHEILFVGSGGIFEYARAADAKTNLHREFMVMLVPHDAPPASRFGNQPRWLYRIKQGIKRLLGRTTTDLYDLERWSVWSSGPAETSKVSVKT